MVWGFCVYFVYMIPLETDVLRKHRFQKTMTARNSHITNASNLITYAHVYMCISCTLVAILMTSSFGPDAELRWVNFFKLLHMPQTLF